MKAGGDHAEVCVPGDCSRAQHHVARPVSPLVLHTIDCQFVATTLCLKGEGIEDHSNSGRKGGE